MAESVRGLFAATHNVAEQAGALAQVGLLSKRSGAGKRLTVIQPAGTQTLICCSKFSRSTRRGVKAFCWRML